MRRPEMAVLSMSGPPIARRRQRCAPRAAQAVRDQALYVQGPWWLRHELSACLRTGRALRVPRARTRWGKSFVTDEIMISERPAEVADRAVPGHWEGDLILGLNSSAIGTLVERTTRFTMLLHLPPMTNGLRSVLPTRYGPQPSYTGRHRGGGVGAQRKAAQDPRLEDTCGGAQ